MKAVTPGRMLIGNKARALGASTYRASRGLCDSRGEAERSKSARVPKEVANCARGVWALWERWAGGGKRIKSTPR